MGRVADGGVGIGPAPGQDRGTVDDHITAPHQVRVAGQIPQHDEEVFVGRGAQPLSALALLGRTRHAHTPAPDGPARPES
jgi:hypothetical protein